MYPILEFDADSRPVISPSLYIQPLPGAKHCVMCFFREVIEKAAREKQARMRAVLKGEYGESPIYEIEHRGKPLAFFHSGVGAPVAAGLMEEAIAYGYSKFVACGAAGVLDSAIQAGKIVIPSSAVRDEGTSYHYVAPSREIDLDPQTVRRLEENLKAGGLPYIVAKTWTTDAFYRETEKRRDRRRAEGCLTVEMECAAFAAVARHRSVVFGQYLYGGDDISGPDWDGRGWEKQSVRETLFWLAADACVTL
jgi:uridine phosphorylase